MYPGAAKIIEVLLILLDLLIDTIETQLNLAIMTRHAELSAYPPSGVPRQLP